MKNKITFHDFVVQVAEETGESKRFVRDLIKETVTLTQQELKNEGLISMTGFGRFYLKWNNARKGKNPRSGLDIEIAAQSSIVFKPELQLKEYINRRYSHLKPEIIQETTDHIETKATTNVQPINETILPTPKNKRKPFIFWILTSVLVVVLLLLFFFFPLKKTSKPVENSIIREHIEAAPEQSTTTNHIEETPEQLVKVEENETTIHAKNYTTKFEDKLWTISQKFYGNGFLWPNIYRANKDKIKNPDNLPIGQNIRIPSLEKPIGNLTQEDIENIAEGFIEVYLFYKKKGKKDANYYLWALKEANVTTIINKYKDKIDPTDLEKMKTIEAYYILK